MARSSECTGSYAHKVLDRDPHCQRRLISSTIVTLIDRGSECKSLWVLKNSLFVPNSQNWGDRKCLPDPRRSIVGLPDAILFLRISWEGVFQQPLLITTICSAQSHERLTCPVGASRLQHLRAIRTDVGPE